MAIIIESTSEDGQIVARSEPVDDNDFEEVMNGATLHVEMFSTLYMESELPIGTIILRYE